MLSGAFLLSGFGSDFACLKFHAYNGDGEMFFIKHCGNICAHENGFLCRLSQILSWRVTVFSGDAIINIIFEDICAA